MAAYPKKLKVLKKNISDGQEPGLLLAESKNSLNTEPL